VHDFIASTSHVVAITKRIEHRKMFIDGDEVCVIYNFVTTMDALASTRIAQWMKIKALRSPQSRCFSTRRPI
jgi:hypothetical protein